MVDHIPEIVPIDSALCRVFPFYVTPQYPDAVRMSGFEACRALGRMFSSGGAEGH